ncbi:FGGY-family carbohydrate kinase [Colwelliaceae bacterium BS250]
MTSDIKINTLVIDIGKTHVKLHVLDNLFSSIFSKQMKNVVELKGDYPSINVTAIWQWLADGIKDVTKNYSISAISITTHGATAALINSNALNSDGLVLPILDYEYQDITVATAEYVDIRPKFSETYSPDLPGGLNIGRQLYWLKKEFPEQFSSATDILMYPQYWLWRFTGQRYAEITSLGCHTDLWSLKEDDYSSLVDTLDCRNLLPPIKPAWFDCGDILPELRAELGLNADCRVFNGIHDSNASFLRYRLTQGEAPFTVISTGTWTILMATQVPLENLDANKDMLANIDATGRAIACARFMGGREFEAVCEKSDSWLGEQFDENDLQQIIEKQVFALPDFSDGSGPFGGRYCEFVGGVNQVSGIALATLYCALMIDYQLDMLGAKGKIFIEGAFLKNPLLCAVLNQLRAKQDVLLSKDSTGTVQGAGYLTTWDDVECSIDVGQANKSSLTALSNYKEQWLKYALEA